MEPKPHPPRLDVLLASEAPVGLVFRRGPRKLVRVVAWNREQDTFKPGQWFKGRIYVDRSDLSPDGKHLIYFAMGGVRWAIAATKGTWTAISCVPSITALALWGQGDTWGGGGMFTSNHSYWLEANQTTFPIRDDSGLRRLAARPHASRLERDGWVIKDKAWNRPAFEKAIANGWSLRRIGWDGGYELEQPGECRLSFPNWEWADWDRHRLAWTESGCLKAAHLGSHKLGPIHTLCDFNAMNPPAR